MGYFVYIIQSEKDGTFYKGFSENPELRLIQHNTAECQTTSKKMPWKIVCLLEFPTKKEALIKEKKLKKYNHQSLLALIASIQNILNLP